MGGRLEDALMRRLALASGEEEAIAAAAAAIAAGGVAVLPTDTLYGFSARYDRPVALARIAALKARADQAPFLLLIHDEDALPLLTTEPPPPAVRGLVWPGPVTLILRARPDLAPLLRGPAATVAVRWPRDRRLAAVIAAVGVPIVSTSVNRQGDAPLGDPARIAADFGAGIDVLVDGGVCVSDQPSTIVDLTVEPPALVRAGAGRVDPRAIAPLMHRRCEP
jgi:L-threonylcarbamoyladenylate synthase